MSYESEAADQVVRMTLNGVEIAARITGRAAERLAALIYAVMKDNKKTRGKSRLNSMLRSGKELTVFSVRDGNMAKFKEEAKRYGILYCILKDRKANDGITDIMVKESDSAMVSRIFERYKLYNFTKGSVRPEPTKQLEAKKDETRNEVPENDGTKDSVEEKEPQPDNTSETKHPETVLEKPPVTERQRIDAYLNDVLAGGVPEKEEPEDPFPKSGRSGNSSETRSSRSTTRERVDESSRPSVRKEMESIRKEQKKAQELAAAKNKGKEGAAR